MRVDTEIEQECAGLWALVNKTKRALLQVTKRFKETRAVARKLRDEIF